jgi:hypothetical protein
MGYFCKKPNLTNMKKIFLLALAISLFSCSKNNDDEQIVTPPADAIAYFRASLNGQALDYSQTNYTTSAYSYSYYNGFQSGPGYFDKSYHFGCIMQPSNNINFYPQIDLTFSSMYNTNSGVSQTDAFYGLFTTIPTNFITSTQETNLVKGINVNYTSPSNVYYSTLNGDQTGSTMTVTSSTTGIEAGGNLKIITIVGIVSCKLYNSTNPADIITLSNGTYKLIFREDY